MRLIELLFITENRKQISLSACGHGKFVRERESKNHAGARKAPLTKLKANTFQLHIRFTLQQSQYEICSKRGEWGRKGKCERRGKRKMGSYCGFNMPDTLHYIIRLPTYGISKHTNTATLTHTCDNMYV